MKLIARAASAVLPTVGAAAAGLLGLAAAAYVIARRVEAAAPAQGAMVDVDGQQIHYVDQGEGPAILLIHGLGGNLRNFSYDLVAELATRFRVVALDRPGSGYSPAPAPSETILGLQADVIAAFIEKLGLGRPLVVGHSLGGALALVLALRHPASVRGLGLISPFTQPTEDVPAAFAGLRVVNPLLRRIIGWTLAAPVTLARRAAIFGELFGPERAPADFPVRGGGYLGLRPEAFYATSSEVVSAPDELPAYHARFGEIASPTAVLFGAGDRVLDANVQGASLPDQIKGATFEAVAGAGHMVFVTRPVLVADFIRRLDRRTQT